VVLAIFAVALSSTGCAKKVVVPDLSQQDVEQAKQMLTAKQLKVGTVSGLPSGSTLGAYVMTQNPAPGQQVPLDSTVDLVAVPPVLVPDLSKAKVTDAVNTLQGLGLKVSLLKQPTANIFSKGHVKQQTPAPNTPVRGGTVVTLMVEAPPDLGVLLGLVTKEPAYEKLDPEYRKILDEFLKPPDATVNASGNSSPSSTPNSTANSAPPQGR
jgi:beta-lactam-binding protein with PASTA domain